MLQVILEVFRCISDFTLHDITFTTAQYVSSRGAVEFLRDTKVFKLTAKINTQWSEYAKLLFLSTDKNIQKTYVITAVGFIM